MLIKKLPIPFVILFLINNSVFGTETSYSDRTFLFCLKPNVSPLIIESSSKNASVDHQELNHFLNKNGAVRIEQWIDNANPMDHDGEIYLNRIYRVYLNEEKNRGFITTSPIEPGELLLVTNKFFLLIF